MRFVNKVFDEVGDGCFVLQPVCGHCFLDGGLSVGSGSWWAGGLCHEPGVRGGLGMAGCDPSPDQDPKQPTMGLVDGAAGRAFTGLGGGSWSWIVVCGRRRSSSRQLHLHRVVVADCQGLEEGERWGGVTQGFGEPLTGVAKWLIALPEPSACWRHAPCPQPRDTRHTRLQFWHPSWRDAQMWPGAGTGRGTSAL